MSQIIPQELKTTLYLYRTLPIKEVEAALGISRTNIYKRIWKAKEDFPEIDCTSFTTLRKEQRENYSENLLEREQIKKQWFAHRQGILNYGSIEGYIKKKGFVVSPTFMLTITKLTAQEVKKVRSKANIKKLHKRYEVLCKALGHYATVKELRATKEYHITMIWHYYKSFNDFLSAHKSGDYYTIAIR